MNKSANLLEIELAPGPASPKQTIAAFMLAGAAAVSLSEPKRVLAALLGVCLLGWPALIAYLRPRRWIIQDRQGSWYIRSDEKAFSFTPGPETRLMEDYVCIVPAQHSFLGLRRWFVRRQSTDPVQYCRLKRELRLGLQAGTQEHIGV